jgi:CheY-like chemotaxis protein
MTIETPTYTVLVVEDEPLIRMTLSDELSGAGFQVLEAANAREAIAILEASPDVVCVVSDVVMPGEMDGISLAWEIRCRWSSVATILSTGKSPPSWSMVPDGTTVLQKPYGLDVLVAAVSGAVAAKRPEQVTWMDPSDIEWGDNVMVLTPIAWSVRQAAQRKR